MDRRDFLAIAGATLATTTPPFSRHLHVTPTRSPARIRAIAFDGFAIFDATTIIPVAESLAPGRGRELVSAWRTRLFEYQWLRTLGGRYADFRQTASDGLAFAAKSLGVTVSDADRVRLVDAQLTLSPWPDARNAIYELRAAGVRLAFLSNMTEEMLDSGAQRGGFRDAFEFVLSTDKVRAAKPDPRAYQLASDAFRLPREEIAFVAFAGWDAAGASWFGYPTIWTNRLSQPSENLGTEIAVLGRDLGAVVSFVTKPA